MKHAIHRLGLLSTFLVLMSCPALRGAEALQKGDLVAICGDSITEQRQYSVFIEDYLLMCQSAADVRAVQFGWGGETSWGFAPRLGNDVLRFKPTVATTCFGMNDAGYSALAEERARMYRDATKAIVDSFKAGGVRFIVIGSPGCVDSTTYRKDPKQAQLYNQALAELRDIAKDVAQKEGVAFADVYTPMFETMTKAKAKFGEQYDVAGPDGVHPQANGHLIMAYAFLKALGCDGAVGTITVDLAASRADSTAGHKVLLCDKGNVEIESTRYPFCFAPGDPADPKSTRGIIEFFPFNEELNRFRLVVTNPGAARLKITWGSATREFPAEQLAKGINLAAEFLDNPFGEAFARVDQAVRKQQDFETPLVRSVIHSVPSFKEVIPEEMPALEAIISKAMAKDQALREQAAAAVAPVRHTIRIEKVQ